MPNSSAHSISSNTGLFSFKSAPYLILTALSTIALLIAYLHISLWQHDSAYYDYDSLYIKIKYEGRWLLPWLVYPFKALNGQAVLMIDLAALFFFFYSVGKRVSSEALYALVFAALCIQIPAHAYQLMWPTNTVPSILILALSVMFVNRLNMFWFYLIFGVLLFATASNYFYLLPLLHLPLLDKTSAAENLKIACLKIIPAWALGFIIGYMASLLAVYVYTYSISGAGQWGIEIKSWRRPNHLESVADLLTNAEQAFVYFKTHLHSVFLKPWAFAVAVIALLTRLALGKNHNFIAVFLICLAMMLSHYVITLPVGIRIDLRTVVNVWLAVFALLFLVNLPIEKSWRVTLLMCCMLALNYSYLRENIYNLKDYSEISNFYYEDFEQAVSQSDLEVYDGIAFLSTHRDVYESNLRVLESQDFDNGKIVWLNTDTRLAPNAYKHGFTNILLCGSTNRRLDACKEIKQKVSSLPPLEAGRKRLHKVLGSYKGYLIIDLDPSVL